MVSYFEEERLFLGEKSNHMVTVTPFMGKLKVHIRQFYENEKGEKKPGKNGKVLEHGEFEALAKLVSKVQDSIARYELKDTGMPLGKTHKSILLRETFLHVRGGGGGYTKTFLKQKLPEKPCQQGRIL